MCERERVHVELRGISNGFCHVFFLAKRRSVCIGRSTLATYLKKGKARDGQGREGKVQARCQYLVYSLIRRCIRKLKI